MIDDHVLEVNIVVGIDLYLQKLQFCVLLYHQGIWHLRSKIALRSEWEVHHWGSAKRGWWWAVLYVWHDWFLLYQEKDNCAGCMHLVRVEKWDDVSVHASWGHAPRLVWWSRWSMRYTSPSIGCVQLWIKFGGLLILGVIWNLSSSSRGSYWYWCRHKHDLEVSSNLGCKFISLQLVGSRIGLSANTAWGSCPIWGANLFPSIWGVLNFCVGLHIHRGLSGLTVCPVYYHFFTVERVK